MQPQARMIAPPVRVGVIAETSVSGEAWTMVDGDDGEGVPRHAKGKARSSLKRCVAHGPLRK